MNELTCAGRFPGNESRVRSGGKSSRFAVAGQLENPGGTAKVAQPVFTEVDELHSVGQLVPQEHLGGAGDNRLPAMGGSHQAGAPIDRQARVAGVVDDHRLVGVQPDPRPQWACGTPWLRRERMLEPAAARTASRAVANAAAIPSPIRANT